MKPIRKRDAQGKSADTAATATDAPPHGVSDQDEGGHAKGAGGDAGGAPTWMAVPNWKRIMALIVIFLIVIVFWMVFHQNGSTLTYFADDNTDWNVSGTISNSINAFWVSRSDLPAGLVLGIAGSSAARSRRRRRRWRSA